MKINDIPHKCAFKAGSSEINKSQENYNFLHACVNADRARDLSDRLSFTSTARLFNVTIIYWFAVNQPDKYQSSYNAERR